MKKLVTLVLTFCLLLVAVVPFAGATGVSNSSVNENSAFVNERVVNLLENNNIDFEIVDGKLSLTDLSSDSIAEVNELLKLTANNQAKSVSALATTYPTSYIHLQQYDRVTSAKFSAATKYALSATFLEWAKSKFLPDPYRLSVVAAGGFGAYYFINSNVENLYTHIQYSFRERGPGRFDVNGNFMGDYELLKEMRVTLNSSNTGGSYDKDIRLSTILEPWF